MRITVAHSPDSDDAFMFFGLASGAVKADGIEVDQVLADIETLNQAAFEGRYEVSAVSFHAYAHLADKYALLPHGASMGDRYGPILVATARARSERCRCAGVRVGVPGRLTSAFLALKLYDPSFDFESHAVRSDSAGGARRPRRRRAADSRRPAHLRGRRAAQESSTSASGGSSSTGGLPLPLGGNIIRRDLGPATIKTVSRMLHDSIAHALEHRSAAVEYAKQFGRGLDERETDRFVGMYVNQLTLDYGSRGRAALDRFFGDAFDQGLIPHRVAADFV